jgi:hypothetical protein
MTTIRNTLAKLWPDKPLLDITPDDKRALVVDLAVHFPISWEEAQDEVEAYYRDIEAEGLGHITLDDLDDGYGED